MVQMMEWHILLFPQLGLSVRDSSSPVGQVLHEQTRSKTLHRSWRLVSPPDPASSLRGCRWGSGRGFRVWCGTSGWQSFWHLGTTGWRALWRSRTRGLAGCKAPPWGWGLGQGLPDCGTGSSDGTGTGYFSCLQNTSWACHSSTPPTRRQQINNYN